MKLNKLVSTLNMEHSTWLKYRRKLSCRCTSNASVLAGKGLEYAAAKRSVRSG